MKTAVKKLKNFLFDQEPFELDFTVPPKEAARRLSTHVHKTAFTGLLSERMIGDVSVVTSVRLQQRAPFIQNQFRPVMDGTFIEKNGSTKLIGVFRLHLIERAIMAVVLTLLSLIFLVILIKTIATASEIPLSLFVIALMFCFCVCIVKISKFSEKDDKEWLLKRVTSTIEKDA
ncbi:hypothetical protein EOL70_00345 [Leucothrix sargassi]|nr:hypothetical protein EOL70_00345 [Leucothrix sargassi]